MKNRIAMISVKEIFKPKDICKSGKITQGEKG